MVGNGFNVLLEFVGCAVDIWLSVLVLLEGLGFAGIVCFMQHCDHLLFVESALSCGLLAGWEPSS